MAKNMTAFASDLKTKNKPRTELKEPRKYGVVLYNDDFTTQDFVVHVLVDIFHKNNVEAIELMYKVHREGKALIAVFTKDIAESKVAIVIDTARNNGMPLMASAEPI